MTRTMYNSNRNASRISQMEADNLKSEGKQVCIQSSYKAKKNGYSNLQPYLSSNVNANRYATEKKESKIDNIM